MLSPVIPCSLAKVFLLHLGTGEINQAWDRKTGLAIEAEATIIINVQNLQCSGGDLNIVNAAVI